MQDYLLRNNIFWCDVGDGLIFLDLHSERYFSLPRADCISLSKFVKGWPACSEATLAAVNSQVAESLVKRGLLTQDLQLGKPMEEVRVKVLDAIEPAGRTLEGESRIRFQHAVRFAMSYCMVSARMRVLGFESVILGLKRRNTYLANNRYSDPVNLKSVLNAFQRIRPLFYTARDRCLVDCLVLIEFLQRSGITANLVIGVEVRPFTAHAWVQHEGTVLTDWRANVQDLTPILVV